MRDDRLEHLWTGVYGRSQWTSGVQCTRIVPVTLNLRESRCNILTDLHVFMIGNIEIRRLRSVKKMSSNCARAQRARFRKTGWPSQNANALRAQVALQP